MKFEVQSVKCKVQSRQSHLQTRLALCTLHFRVRTCVYALIS
jgi:hypothetical protein